MKPVEKELLCFPGLVEEISADIKNYYPCSDVAACVAAWGVVAGMIRGGVCLRCWVLEPGYSLRFSHEAIKKYLEDWPSAGWDYSLDEKTKPCQTFFWFHGGWKLHYLGCQGGDKNMFSSIPFLVVTSDQQYFLDVTWKSEENSLINSFLVIPGSECDIVGFHQEKTKRTPTPKPRQVNLSYATKIKNPFVKSLAGIVAVSRMKDEGNVCVEEKDIHLAQQVVKISKLETKQAAEKMKEKMNAMFLKTLKILGKMYPWGASGQKIIPYYEAIHQLEKQDFDMSAHQILNYLHDKKLIKIHSPQQLEENIPLAVELLFPC